MLFKYYLFKSNYQHVLMEVWWNNIEIKNKNKKEENETKLINLTYIINNNKYPFLGNSLKYEGQNREFEQSRNLTTLIFIEIYDLHTVCLTYSLRNLFNAMDAFSSFFDSQSGSRTRWSHESLKNFRQISPAVQSHLQRVSSRQIFSCFFLPICLIYARGSWFHSVLLNPSL